MKKTRILCLVLALVMCLGLVACGGNNDKPNDNDNPNNNPSDNDNPNTPEGPQPPVDDGTLAADVYTMDAFDAAGYPEKSDEIYDKVLGEYYEYYQQALAEQDPNQRIAKMAIAEAKLLESGVLVPMQNNTVGQQVSKIVPHTHPTVSWGNDGDYRGYQNELIVNERPLTPAERGEVTKIWSQNIGTGNAYSAIKSYIEGLGLTFNDTLTSTYSTAPVTWDVMASIQSSTNEYVSLTFDGLLVYDNENVQQPGLAESYEISDDGLTYTFHLRKGVKWVTSQGAEIAELKADDFVAGLQHVSDTKAGTAWLVYCIENYEAYDNGEITDFSQVGVKAIDDYTLQYTLTEPTAWFITICGYTPLAPLCRSYYTSQGGKFGTEFDNSASDYVYGTTPDNIAYCGAFLITNYTYQNTIAFTANPTYYGGEGALKNITFRYVDGSDPLVAFNGFMDGLYPSFRVSSAVAEIASKTPAPDDPSMTILEKYAFSDHDSAIAIVNFNNIYRYSYANNFNDASAMRSPKTVVQAERTAAAMMNQNFRMALVTAFDRYSYYRAQLGETDTLGSATNSFVPGNFVALTADTTVDMNGTSQTFKTGTFYGEILQAAVDSDGFKVKVWDPEGSDGAGSSVGFDGWYNPEAASEYLDKAIEELAEQGILVNEDYPIYLDMPYDDYNTNLSAAEQALKQSYEKAFGNRVIINLIPGGDSDTVADANYNPEHGYHMNYDIGGNTGWMPDYGDAQSYLNCFLPNGDMDKAIGLY